MKKIKCYVLILNFVNFLGISNGWMWHDHQTSTWWIISTRVPGLTTSRNSTWLQFNNFYFSKASDDIVPAIYNITDCDCPRIYMPICATDGRSYTNICWMNCKNWTKVEAKELGKKSKWDPNARDELTQFALEETSPHQVQLFHKGHCVSLLDPYYESVWKADPKYEPDKETKMLYARG